MMIKPILNELYSPDVEDLQRFVPDDPKNVGILIQLLVGSSDRGGAESFDVLVCTPDWIRQEVEFRGGILDGRHHVIVDRWDWPTISSYLRMRVEEVGAADWQGVAMKLGRLGRWEFQDYVNGNG